MEVASTSFISRPIRWSSNGPKEPRPAAEPEPIIRESAEPQAGGDDGSALCARCRKMIIDPDEDASSLASSGSSSNSDDSDSKSSSQMDSDKSENHPIGAQGSGSCNLDSKSGRHVDSKKSEIHPTNQSDDTGQIDHDDGGFQDDVYFQVVYVFLIYSRVTSSLCKIQRLFLKNNSSWRLVF